MIGTFEKLIHECPTPSRWDQFEVGVGSIWRCRCGKRWVLKRGGRMGDYWWPVNEDAKETDA